MLADTLAPSSTLGPVLLAPPSASWLVAAAAAAAWLGCEPFDPMITLIAATSATATTMAPVAISSRDG